MDENLLGTGDGCSGHAGEHRVLSVSWRSEASPLPVDATMIWERDGDAYYASVETPAGGVLYRLVVERLDHHWDWTVWNPGEPPTKARHGMADTIHDAMRAAELAATV